jgi:predicted flap endonuclease-1-like 5' DNA nuclease
MNGLGWLVLGLLAGWLIELAIDYRYWRRHARITASRLAEQEAALNARAQSLDARQAEQDARNEELTALQAALAARDADLLGLAKRIDERAEEVTRLEQAMDKRRADLDRMGLTLNEREKDIAARDGKLKAAEVDYGSRHEQLQAAEADVSRRVAVVSNRESAMQNWEARILAREHELGDKEAELVREAAAASALRAELSDMKQLVARQYRTAEGDDNLEAIEGIGEKVARLLKDADIRTFERLSETSLGELSRILEAGGPRLGLADPLTWAEQASCLASGDYIAFERMKGELIGDSRRDAALLQESAEAATDASVLPEPLRNDAAGDAGGAAAVREAEAGSGTAAEVAASPRGDEHGPRQDS